LFDLIALGGRLARWFWPIDPASLR